MVTIVHDFLESINCCAPTPADDETLLEPGTPPYMRSRVVAINKAAAQGLFTTTIEKSPSEKWGMDLDFGFKTRLLVIDVFNGPIKRYNASHPDKAIEANDWIEKVDSCDSSAIAMAEIIKNGSNLTLSIRKSWHRDEPAQVSPTAIGSPTSKAPASSRQSSPSASPRLLAGRGIDQALSRASSPIPQKPVVRVPSHAVVNGYPLLPNEGARTPLYPAQVAPSTIGQASTIGKPVSFVNGQPQPSPIGASTLGNSAFERFVVPRPLHTAPGRIMPYAPGTA